MFELDKWYLDLITNDGGAFVGYAAMLHWRGLRVGYESFLFAPATGQAVERTTLRGALTLTSEGGTLRWNSHALGLSGTWEREIPSIERRLQNSDRGSVDWACHQPRSRARVRLPDGRQPEGTGYAERLRLTLPPMDLALDTLHWGRFHGDGETLVWIEWQNGENRRWIFRNGEEQRRALLVEGGIRDFDDGSEFRFGGTRTLRDRPVWPVLQGIPGLKKRAVGRLANMHETKWIGRGGLRAPGAASTDGWYIHEEVTWHRVRAPQADCFTARSS